MSKDFVEIDGKEIRVWQVTEDDAVAAECDTDAVEWYKNNITDDYINDYEDITPVDLDKVILEGEGTTKETTVRRIVEEHWTGEPFITVTVVH